MAALLDGMAASSSIILPPGRVDGNPKSPLQKTMDLQTTFLQDFIMFLLIYVEEILLVQYCHFHN
jgi:hypothetical protein